MRINITALLIPAVCGAFAFQLFGGPPNAEREKDLPLEHKKNGLVRALVSYRKSSGVDAEKTTIRITESVRELNKVESSQYELVVADHLKRDPRRANEIEPWFDILIREVDIQLIRGTESFQMPSIGRARLSKKYLSDWPYEILACELLEDQLFVVEKDGRDNRLLVFDRVWAGAKLRPLVPLEPDNVAGPTAAEATLSISRDAGDIALRIRFRDEEQGWYFDKTIEVPK